LLNRIVQQFGDVARLGETSGIAVGEEGSETKEAEPSTNDLYVTVECADDNQPLAEMKEDEAVSSPALEAGNAVDDGEATLAKPTLLQKISRFFTG
jgi:hypothetical protein